MDPSRFGGGPWEAYKDALDDRSITGIVTVVETDEPFDAWAFEMWEVAGQRAAVTGVRRWAIVADQLERLSTQSQLDATDLDVRGFEDRDEALDWARGDG